MKRFEYKYVFKTREDKFLTSLMKEYNLFYEPTPLREINVTTFLDSYKVFKSRFPIEFNKFYDFVRLERTGNKTRSIKYIIYIRLYQLKRYLKCKI